MLWCPPDKPLVAFSSMLTSLVSFWPDEECMRAGGGRGSDLFPWRTRTLQDHHYTRCNVILMAVLCNHPVHTVPLKCDPSGGQRWQRRNSEWEGAVRLWYAALCLTSVAISFSGKFREKASILHKIAKKKCQVEDSEKANGVTSRSGKRLGWVPKSWILRH